MRVARASAISDSMCPGNSPLDPENPIRHSAANVRSSKTSEWKDLIGAVERRRHLDGVRV